MVGELSITMFETMAPMLPWRCIGCIFPWDKQHIKTCHQSKSNNLGGERTFTLASLVNTRPYLLGCNCKWFCCLITLFSVRFCFIKSYWHSWMFLHYLCAVFGVACTKIFCKFPKEGKLLLIILKLFFIVAVWGLSNDAPEWEMKHSMFSWTSPSIA